VWVVVTPVAESGGAAVDLIERTHQVADVDVVGAIVRRDAAAHVGEVLRQRPVGPDGPQGGLPGVQVRIDQAGNDDPALQVDDVSACRLEVGARLCDDVVLDQHVDTFAVGAVGRHGDHLRAAQQYPSHR
jgi:hypothetical protein